MLLFREGQRALSGVLRIEGSGAVSRIVDYHYAADTLVHVAGALGFECVTRGYRQPDEMLQEMIATTALPWRDG